MNRYFNSFLITTLLYSILGATLFYAFDKIVVVPSKEEEIITKISLSSVEIAQNTPKIEEPVVEPEIIPEPIIEKPTPIVKKDKPKHHKKHHPKPPHHHHKKPIEQKHEVVENVVTTNNQETKQDTPVPPKFSKEQINSAEARYLAKIHSTIEKNKNYPRAAKRLNQTGVVHISFDILKNGDIKNVKIIKNSKFEKLDSASIELLLNIGKFDEIPTEIDKAVWNIVVPISYQIN